MESRFRHDFSRVRIHDDARAEKSLAAINARAYAVGSHVVVGNQPSEQSVAREFTLAHELAHVVQQRTTDARSPLTVGDPHDPLEREADRTATLALHGRLGVQSPQLSTLGAQPGIVRRQLKDQVSPYEGMLIEHAKHRLAILKQYVDEYTIRGARRERGNVEIREMRERRAQMDIQGSNPFDEMAPRRDLEAQRMSALNTAPVNVDVTDEQVTIRVRFHVRFEDGKMESRFGDLKSTIEKAAETTWNQKLTGSAFGGRRFAILPEVTKVSPSAARDQGAWLITVRPSDTAAVAYPGCKLDQPEPGALTSVTDPTCDGGVMSIPPAHTTRADIIGHEMMHLFGFVDRYVQQTIEKKGQRPKVVLQSTRKTGGRPDPLGADRGPVLAEDLSMLFEHVGVYDAETVRGLDTLRQLERQGMKLGDVLAEIHRQEEIIKTGRDPDSLLPEKKSFKQKILDSVEDIP